MAAEVVLAVLLELLDVVPDDPDIVPVDVAGNLLQEVQVDRVLLQLQAHEGLVVLDRGSKYGA